MITVSNIQFLRRYQLSKSNIFSQFNGLVKGKSTWNHRFSWGFPVKFPLNQSIDQHDSEGITSPAAAGGPGVWTLQQSALVVLGHRAEAMSTLPTTWRHDDVFLKKHQILMVEEFVCIYIYIYGYGSIPINTIFSGMNIHLPAILMFTRGTRFWHTAI